MTKKIVNMWGEETTLPSKVNKSTHPTYKHLEYIDGRRITLGHEVQEHPILLGFLAKHGPDDVELKLAEIAAYCEVIMEGDYLPEDLDNLCEVLTFKLKEKRGGIQYVPAPDYE